MVPSNSSLNPEPNLPKTPVLFWWLLAGTTGLALIPTAWTALDLWAAGHFLGPGSTQAVKAWWWVEWINLYVPAAFRILVGISLLLALWVSFLTRTKLRWRLPLIFIVVSGALGPGILVNSGFKDNWQRARPYQVSDFGGTQQFTRAAVMTDQCDNNCSFVSGHVACGFFFASLMLVAPRRRYAWGSAGLLAGWMIGFARMADGAHWLSDVLWACPITLVCSWIVWRTLLRISQNEGRQAEKDQPA